MLAIRLPETIEKRLDRLAKRTGRTKTYYAREAILQHLDKIEDIYLAEKRLEVALGAQPDYSARKSNAASWLEGISRV
jgi:predicted DNA-binding protein